MSQQQVLQIAKKSMKDNKKLLSALGTEKSVKIVHHPEEDTINKLLALLPKSDLGKLALIGAIALVGYELLRSKD